MDNRRPGSSGYGIAAACFALVWLAFCWPWLSGAVTIPYDAKAHFQTQIHFLAQAIHSGQSPLWLPHAFAGSPQIADPQSMIFSPALLLALLSPEPSFRAVDTLVLAHLLVGGLGMLLFFRERGWHPAGAVVAAIVFALGASAAWRVQHVGQIVSLAFFPVALWLTARALTKRTILSGTLAGLAGALMIVEPNQVALLGAYVIVAYVVAHWFQAGRGAVAASVRPLAATAVIGATVVVLPLMWTVLFASSSTREVIGLAEAARGSLDPASLLTAWVGDLFGAASPNVEFWGPYSPSWNPNELFLSQNMSQIYMGALPVLLVVVPGLSRGWLLDRQVRVFALVLLALILFALGRFTPVFGLMFHYLPGVDAFRRPADATFLIGAVGGIVAGYLVHRLVAEKGFRPHRVEWIIAGAVVLAVLATALLVAWRSLHLADALRPVALALGWLTVAALGLTLMVRAAPARPGLAVALLALIAGSDLAANNGPNESTALPPERYDVLRPDTTNETVRLLKQKTARIPGSPRRDRVELVGLGFDWPNCGAIHGFEHTLGYNPLRLAEFSDAVGTRDTIAGPDQRKFTPLFPSYRSTLADLLGLRFIASSVPLGQIDRQLRPGDLTFVGFTSEGYIYENPRALPRAMFVPGWQTADFQALRRSGNWPEFDPTRTVLLEDDPEDLTGIVVPPAPPSTGSPPPQVRLIRYANTEIEIEVDAPSAGLVVLNDIWHPWWIAEVDGTEVEIMKANVLFRAVPVAAGRHLVRFSFRPLQGALTELVERVSDDE